MNTLIIILNYRTADLTLQCLDSLSSDLSFPSTQVMVVDNFSEDGSVQKIEETIQNRSWKKWVFLLALQENRGYAAGNNQAIERALSWKTPPHFFFILNPDTLVEKGAVSTLINFMQQHPKVGICGSRLKGIDGKLQCSAFRFPSLISEFDSALRLGILSRLLKKWLVHQDIQDHPHQTDWISGASFMVRREVFEHIGRMDEKYFLYFEELDFCLQAKKAGWEIWYVPKSEIIHLVGQSTGIGQLTSKATPLPAYWFESRRRYFQKNHGRPYAIFVDLTWMFGFFLWKIRSRLQRKQDLSPPSLLFDFFRYSSLFHSIVK